LSKVKIIATIGPSSANLIKEIVLAGASGLRVNFSHADQKEWAKYVRAVRKADGEVLRPIALIGDLRGGSVRIGKLPGEIRFKFGDELKFKLKGSGDVESKTIPLPVKEFFEVVEVGDLILMDDGNLIFEVDGLGEGEVRVKALTAGRLTSNKGVVIRGKEIPVPTISDRDLNCIKFAVKNDFDYIALSYVKSGEDIRLLRDILDEFGANEIGVMAKIESVGGVNHLSDVVRLSDAILVARGDLGMQFPLEKVPLLQRKIIDECLRMGKPVIVATQVLSSMIENPSPTRAEVTDVVNAISEGADAIMLTGETAIGEHPLEAVKWLKRIIDAYDSKVMVSRPSLGVGDVKLSFAYSVVVLSESLNAKLAVYTKMGRTALRIARFRPATPFYAASNNIKTLRKLAIVWGIKPLRVEAKDYHEGVDATYMKLIKLGELKTGEIAVLTYGILEEYEHTIKIVRVK